MLNKNKSKKVAILKYGLAVPLFAAMVIFSSATAAGKKVINTIAEHTAPVLENLSNAELKGFDETDSPDLSVKPVKKATGKVKAEGLAKAEKNSDARGKTTYTPEIPDNTSKRDSVKNVQPKNLMDYINKFFTGEIVASGKEGLVYFSFDVTKDKKTNNYRILKNINSDWEKELLTHLQLFKDTVNLAQGTYNFFQEIRVRDFDDPVGVRGSIFIPKPGEVAPKPINFLFGNRYSPGFSYITNDETKEEAGKIVNYILVGYVKNPVILVDGKIATYEITKKGFKLDETIYPREAKIKIYRGNRAVEKYDESARSGLIVVTTSAQHSEKKGVPETVSAQ